MGRKVNVFLGFCCAYGVIFSNFNMKMLFALLAWFTAIYKHFKVWQFTQKFSGEIFFNNWKSLFGNSSTNFHAKMNELWEKCGRDKFITWVGFERFITVSKLNDVQRVLNVTEDASFMENYQQMWPWLGGDDVIKAGGFSSKDLVEALVKGPFHRLTQSDEFIKKVNKRCEEMCQEITTGDAIDMQPTIKTMAFDVILGIAMGTELKSQRRELFEAGEKLCQMADQRIYSGWKQNKWLLHVLGEESRVAQLQNVFTQCVKKVLNEKRDGSVQDVSCLLDALVANKELSQDEIAATLTGFIVLGYDRLASLSCFALMELAKKETIQKNIHRELKINTPIVSLERVKSLESLENFINETQRLYPSTPCISKWITVGIPLNGYFIPPNSSVFIYLNGTGRDAYRFANPEHFDVNRANLTDTFGEKSHEINLPSTLMKVLLGNLLGKYQFRKEKGNVEIGTGLSLRTNGVRANVTTQ